MCNFIFTSPCFYNAQASGGEEVCITEAQPEILIRLEINEAVNFVSEVFVVDDGICFSIQNAFLR